MRQFFRSNSKFRPFLLAVVLSTVLLLSGCEFGIDFGELLARITGQISPQPTATHEIQTPTFLPGTTSTALPQETDLPPAAPGMVELEIWLPPHFDPKSGTLAGDLLEQRIQLFEQEHNGVFVNVRVKPASGPTGILESLSITSQAASAAMPSITALTRSDLEVAVSQNLVYSLDSYSDTIDEEDWFPYARNLTIVGGSSYGLPFAGDAFMLLMRPEVIGSQPVTWNDVLRRGEPLAFPAADPQAVFAMALYQAAGGNLENVQRLAQLDLELLTQVFQIFADGSFSGAFPMWTTEVQRDSDAWTAYNELRSNWVVTWSTRYLQDMSGDTLAVSFPIIRDMPVNTADGWSWCVTDPLPEQHPLAAELLEFLTEADFLAEWSQAAGVLPVRPSALEGRADQDLVNVLEQIALTARVKPRNEVISILGPIFTEQVVAIVSGRTTAPIAAQAVIDKVGNP